MSPAANMPGAVRHQRFRIDFYGALTRGLDAIAGVRNERSDAWPMARMTVSHGMTALGSRLETGIETMLRVENRRAANSFEAGHFAVLADEPASGRAKDASSSFLDAFLDLLFESRHLLARLQAHQMDFPGPHAQRRA